MKINILNKGDRVLNVTDNFIAVERKTGEVDLIHIDIVNSIPHIDISKIVTIGYGNNSVETVTEDGVTITTF